MPKGICSPVSGSVKLFNACADSFPNDDEAQMMVVDVDGMKVEDAAKKWLKQNAGRVNSWIDTAKN
jgi:ABC-type proline/glycine betaine transport system substrate-binding protein